MGDTCGRHGGSWWPRRLPFDGVVLYLETQTKVPEHVSPGEVGFRIHLLHELFLKNDTFFTDFQNAVIPQRVDEFLRSTPEMKARGAYVPFLLSKPLNKNEISELSVR